MFRDFPQVLPSCSNTNSWGDTVNTQEALKHDTTQYLTPTTLPTCITEHKAACSSVHQCACGMSTAYAGLAVGFFAPLCMPGGVDAHPGTLPQTWTGNVSPGKPSHRCIIVDLQAHAHRAAVLVLEWDHPSPKVWLLSIFPLGNSRWVRTCSMVPGQWDLFSSFPSHVFTST